MDKQALLKKGAEIVASYSGVGLPGPTIRIKMIGTEPDNISVSAPSHSGMLLNHDIVLTT